MRTRSRLSGVGVAVVVLAACGSSSYGSGSGAATTSASRYGNTGTAAAAAAASATTAAAATNDYGSPSTAAAAGGVAGGLALADTSLGKVLVDGDGRTLYLFTKDSPGKPSVCSGGCATTWPPVVVTAAPAAGSGLDATKVTLVARADGSQQVAYAGWPLYRFADDAKAGDVNGEKVGGIWFAVDASGNAVKG